MPSHRTVNIKMPKRVLFVDLTDDGAVLPVPEVKRSRVQTPPREKNPCPPKLPKIRRNPTLSRLLTGKILEVCNIGTPVKKWSGAFWTARRMLYEGETAPATPVKISPQE